MRSGLYRTIARNNIRKNYRFFIPRMLSEAGLLACFYIALTLALDDRLSKARGGSYIPTFMWMGTAVLGILSLVLMLYTNSFLMKQRKREFGLYNVLGMEKKHIGRVLFHESLLSGSAAVLGGLGLGILFYKLCSLLICRLLESEIVIGFYFITPKTLIPAAGFFILTDALTYFLNRLRISKMKPVELLQSKAAGEREPKVKWLMLLLGILTLGGGYYISLVTKSPLEALVWFFIAVILVILGTYFLFITGSTFVLKGLKNNKKYYYSKKHMPAVSGLLYRMKQNAVGLASIAILATGVLVMISTTVSLYTDYQKTLDKSYPQHLYLSASCTLPDGRTENVSDAKLTEIVREAADRNGVEIRSVAVNEFLEVAYYVQDNCLYAESEAPGNVTFSGISEFIFITADTYEALSGEKLELQDGETAVCRISSSAKDLRGMQDAFTLHGKEYRIARTLVNFPVQVQILASAFNCYGVVVADGESLGEIYAGQKAAYGEMASDFTRRIAVCFEDLAAAEAAGETLGRDIRESLREYILGQLGGESDTARYTVSLSSYWDARESLLGMYGTLLFLGILLGAVCLFATALIIYYKQISEGYEDRDRFQIMEKIGMSRREVRKTVNSQVLLVFFLPLLVAGVHLAFAFPMLAGMMKILSLFSVRHFVLCALCTYAAFALVYVLIYAGTSKTYYKIVH